MTVHSSKPKSGDFDVNKALMLTGFVASIALLILVAINTSLNAPHMDVSSRLSILGVSTLISAVVYFSLTTMLLKGANDPGKSNRQTALWLAIIITNGVFSLVTTGIYGIDITLDTNLFAVAGLTLGGTLGIYLARDHKDNVEERNTMRLMNETSASARDMRVSSLHSYWPENQFEVEKGFRA